MRKGWFSWLEAWDATVRARRCVSALRHRGTRQALNSWRSAGALRTFLLRTFAPLTDYLDDAG